MSITLCVRIGNVVLYVSAVITSPNSAFYEYKLNVSRPSCDTVYIAPPLGDLSALLTYIYPSLIGVDEYSEFLINTTVGGKSVIIE